MNDCPRQNPAYRLTPCLFSSLPRNERAAPVERESAARGKPPCQGALQVRPCMLNGFIPEADVPDKGAYHEHQIA